MEINEERLRILARIYRRMALGWDDGETKYPDHGAERGEINVEVLDAWERDFENFVSVMP